MNTEQIQPRTPLSGVTVCAGVDVMSDRLHVAIRAYGPQAEIDSALLLSDGVELFID